MTSYTRKISNSEKIYFTGEKIAPPFCIQMIIEYKGSLDLEKLQKAVTKSSDVNPGVRLIKKNNKWIDSKVPPIVSIFECNNLKSITKKRLDPHNGPTSEVYLSRKMIVFRGLHSVMDARGLLEWVKDIFRSLNNNIMIGNHSTVNDKELIRSQHNNIFRKNFSMDCLSPTGLYDHSENNNEYVIDRLTMKNPIPGIVSQLAQIATDATQSPGRFMIPVDLRSHFKDIKSTGNLSNPIFIETTPGNAWGDVQIQILKKLQSEEYLSTGKWDFLINFCPDILSKFFFKKLTKYQLIHNKYMLSGIISDIGFINTKDFSTQSTKATSIYFLPICVPIVPFSIVTTESHTHVEITVSMHKSLASKGRLEKFFKYIESHIKIKQKEKEIIPSTDLEYQYIYPKDKTVNQLFSDQCIKTPQHIAVRHNNEEISYMDLEKKANQLANFLISKGAKTGIIIALISDHSIETIISILGIIKTGAAYLPIDPKYPKERIDYLITNSGASFILQSTLAKNDEIVSSIPSFSINDKHIKQCSIQLKKNNFSSNELIYVIYTSGSTGRPKGVAIEHKSLINYSYWAIKTFLDHNSYVFPLYSSLSFDLTVTSIFVPLLAGHTIEVFGSEYSGLSIKKIVQSPHINFLKATPSHLKIIKELTVNPKGIKVLVVGGEELTTELAYSISQKYNHQIKIFNEYGPTEATIGCVSHLYDPINDNFRCIPIGKPIQNTFIKIMDPVENESYPQGIGELLIGGDGLARGYLNNPEKNNEKFITLKGQRFYRSGDLVKWIDENTLDYVGRLDEQVKINGHRIELGEIEYYIQNIKDVNQVAVLGIPLNNDNELMLCAYAIAHPSITSEIIKKELLNNLPPYMIPSKIFFLDKMPITINGKIDKSKLPIPDHKRRPEKIKNITTQNQDHLHKQITDIWLRVLDIQNIERSSETSFYDLGGNSIQLLTILSLIKDEILPEKNEDDVLKLLAPILNNPTINNIYSSLKKISKNDDNPPNMKFRDATLNDSHDVIDLLLESSAQAFLIIFNEAEKKFRDFLNFAFHKGDGFFGYKYQKVGLKNNKIVLVSTIYNGQISKKLFFQTLWQLISFYSYGDAIKILSKVFKIRHSFTSPQKDGLYLSNFCTHSQERRKGGSIKK